MTQNDPVFGMRHQPADIANATGLPPDAIDASLPIETVSTGFPFAIVPLRSLDAIRALNLDLRRADEYLRRSDARLFYFVTRDTGSVAARLHARMIFYAGEDPATGSAAGCAAAWMDKERETATAGSDARRPASRADGSRCIRSRRR
jgi:trans-2,3-dihydro-3-hydroxyanthranilate isomerase